MLVKQKKWPEICSLNDVWLRAAVTHSTDEATLAGLQSAFPHLFSPEPAECLPVPLSAILDRCRMMVDNDVVMMQGILDHFNIPSFSWWGDNYEKWKSSIPMEWVKTARQLCGKRRDYDLLRTPKRQFVDWNGVEHVVVEVLIEPGCDSSITIAPSNCFDLTR